MHGRPVSSMLRIGWAVLFGAAATFGVASIDSPPRLPDAASGIIDGKAGLLFWPAALRDDGSPGVLLPVQGCEVHATLYDEPEKEFRYPCGEWFVPPPSRYLMWMEQGDTISPAQIPTNATGKGTAGLRSIHPMVSAGYVAMSGAVRLNDDVSARFINLTPMYRSFTRSVPGPNAHEPVRIPEGRVSGGVFDRRTGNALSLFPSADVRRGQTMRFAPAVTARDRSALFVVLKSPLRRRNQLHVALKTAGRLHPPDDVVDGGQWIYAIWRSVPPGTASLEISNDTVIYDGLPLILRPGAVTTRRDELKLKSSS